MGRRSLTGFTSGAGVLGLAADVGLPVAAYYVLRAFGLSETTALPVAASVAALRVLWVAIVRRQLTWFATVMLAVYTLGFVLALVGGDARFLILQHSFTSAAVAVVFLASAFTGRPLTLAALQAWQPARANELAEAHRTVPHVRRGLRINAVVWGVGLLAEAAARVPIVYVLPLDAAVGASTALQIVAFSTLGAYTVLSITRARRRGWFDPTRSAGPEPERT